MSTTFVNPFATALEYDSVIKGILNAETRQQASAVIRFIVEHYDRKD